MWVRALTMAMVDAASAAVTAAALAFTTHKFKQTKQHYVYEFALVFVHVSVFSGRFIKAKTKRALCAHSRTSHWLFRKFHVYVHLALFSTCELCSSFLPLKFYAQSFWWKRVGAIPSATKRTILYVDLFGCT